MKDSNEVIEEFNELVNMTATELEKWLKSDDSNSAGWPKEDGGGESVGHDSGRKIVEILKSNPNKDPEKYTDDQVQHMRKVVSYCKRHLAQEEKIDNEKSVEELKKTKSYASLKNWGHDVLKKRGKTDEAAAEDDGGEEAQEEEEKQAGDKRKAAGGQTGAKKKRETQKGESNGADQEGEDAAEDEEELEELDEEEGDDEGQEKKSNGKASNGQRKTRSQDAKNADKQDEAEDDDGEEEEEEDAGGDEGGSKKTKNGPKKGDTVSWNWGQGHPEGKVLDVKPEETTIETKRGNEVSRKGTEEDPAVVLDTGKSKAIKLDHELN